MVGKVYGLDELMKQISRIGTFPKEQAKELRQANKEVGKFASTKLKNKLKPLALGDDFLVYKGTPGPGRARKGEGVVRKRVPSGTLWRSIGVKNARGSKINVFVGPRYGGRSIRMDGYFAHMVEAGDIGGRNRSRNSPAYGKIVPTLARLSARMTNLMIIKYRKVFDKYKL